jgi:ActR/RegA family two-component response regulator
MAPRDKPLVLLIEDDAASAEALILILRDWGADVAHADRADALAEALAGRAAAVRYIIADFNLGAGPDGVSLARDVAASAPSSRVLVLSGCFNGSASAAAERAGFDMMHKPARADAILAWLDRP